MRNYHSSYYKVWTVEVVLIAIIFMVQFIALGTINVVLEHTIASGVALIIGVSVAACALYHMGVETDLMREIPTHSCPETYTTLTVMNAVLLVVWVVVWFFAAGESSLAVWVKRVMPTIALLEGLFYIATRSWRRGRR